MPLGAPLLQGFRHHLHFCPRHRLVSELWNSLFELIRWYKSKAKSLLQREAWTGPHNPWWPTWCEWTRHVGVELVRGNPWGIWAVSQDIPHNKNRLLQRLSASKAAVGCFTLLHKPAFSASALFGQAAVHIWTPSTNAYADGKADGTFSMFSCSPC